MKCVPMGFFVLGVLTNFCQAADWPQWRGPERDGAAPAFLVPKTWPAKLQQQWKVEVGEGYASPVVAGDRVFLISRQKDDEVVRALALADGRQLWSQSYPAPYEMNHYVTSHGKGPKSTPAIAGGRLVTLGISGVLSCWDALTGKRLWQREFSKDYPRTWPLYGTSASPMILGDRVIAYVGGHDSGALAAFDVESGKVAWRWAGDGPAYSSPILVNLAGTPQIVVQSQKACIGVAESNGALLWSLPYETEYIQNVVTPLVAGDLVIFSGYHKGTEAYRVTKAGDRWSAARVWHNEPLWAFMSSPVVVGKRLFGLAYPKKGQFFCLDVAAGKTLWTSDGRMGENALLAAAGQTLLALTTGSELIAFRADADRFEPVARYQLADTPTWAHPALLGNQVLVKDKTAVTLWKIGE